jgi:3-oxoacyl-[acyl-carrier-protein] synthase-3
VSVISAVEHFVPENAVTNNDLAAFMDTSDEWIQTRTGIKERHWVRKGNEEFRGITSHEMVCKAAIKAFKASGISARDIDIIFYATISPDNEMPGSGVLLKKLLGIERDIPVFEIRNQCSGFLYALQAARAYTENGKAQNVLVVGAEIQSTGLDLSTRGRNTAVLFADGAGVIILSASSQNGHKLLNLKLRSSGIYHDKLGIKFPAYARPEYIKVEDFCGDAPGIYPNMDGKFVFKMASVKMPEIVKEILSESGYTLKDLKAVIPHQANLRIIEMLSASLGPEVKVFSNIQQYGNTTAASIPIALSEASKQNYLEKGDLVCLVSFGAGFSWGAALIIW